MERGFKIKRSLLLVSVLLCGHQLFAQALRGVIRDPEGALLDRAVVVVLTWSGDALHASTPSQPLSVQPDSKGRYSLNLSPGLYDVLFSCPFCEPQIKQVRVKPGTVLHFSPHLKASRLTPHID